MEKRYGNIHLYIIAICGIIIGFLINRIFLGISLFNISANMWDVGYTTEVFNSSFSDEYLIINELNYEINQINDSSLVCRHRSKMLKDSLDQYGINSSLESWCRYSVYDFSYHMYVKVEIEENIYYCDPLNRRYCTYYIGNMYFI